MHFHRDVMAACDCWPQHVLRADADDVFIGSPPLAFTFGLGGLLLFPLRIGASTVLLEKAPPDACCSRRSRSYGATVLFTAPTVVPRDGRGRTRERRVDARRRLRKCVSAGEALPAATRKLWKDATGIEIIDGIGSTEMLHIFISADEAHARARRDRQAGARLPRLRDGRRRPRRCRPAQVGRLAVKGPTGCRYLDDARQAQYVQDGWNYTGDAYLIDADGYFVYQARTDDMIISAGYNIAGPRSRSALLLHPAVAECGVIGAPDDERGQIVKAFVVLKPGARGRRRDGARAAGLRQADDRAVQVPARDRVRRRAAAHRDRQAAALPAARAGLSGRRSCQIIGRSIDELMCIPSRS